MADVFPNGGDALAISPGDNVSIVESDDVMASCSVAQVNVKLDGKLHSNLDQNSGHVIAVLGGKLPAAARPPSAAVSFSTFRRPRGRLMPSEAAHAHIPCHDDLGAPHLHRCHACGIGGGSGRRATTDSRRIC